MQGYNALWMPGTDHAGIATQAVVERGMLEEEKKTRHDLGREELVERIWAWKNEYETRILGQLEHGLQLRLAAHAVHARSECCTRAVRHTFFQPVQRRPDLSRHAAGELGHDAANRRQRRRSVSRNRRRPFLAPALSGASIRSRASPHS